MNYFIQLFWLWALGIISFIYCLAQLRDLGARSSAWFLSHRVLLAFVFAQSCAIYLYAWVRVLSGTLLR